MAAADDAGSGFVRRKTVTAHNDASMRTVADFGEFGTVTLDEPAALGGRRRRRPRGRKGPVRGRRGRPPRRPPPPPRQVRRPPTPTAGAGASHRTRPHLLMALRNLASHRKRRYSQYWVRPWRAPEGWLSLGEEL